MTEKPAIAFVIKLSTTFDRTIELLSEELKKEGFGILTRIDAHKVLKEKLDVDFHPYAILGACNPPLAHKAISTDSAVGLMLPCNIIVESLEDGNTIIQIANPQAMMAIGQFSNLTLADVALQAKERLWRVSESLKRNQVVE